MKTLMSSKSQCDCSVCSSHSFGLLHHLQNPFYSIALHCSRGLLLLPGEFSNTSSTWQTCTMGYRALSPNISSIRTINSPYCLLPKASSIEIACLFTTITCTTEIGCLVYYTTHSNLKIASLYIFCSYFMNMKVAEKMNSTRTKFNAISSELGKVGCIYFNSSSKRKISVCH